MDNHQTIFCMPMAVNLFFFNTSVPTNSWGFSFICCMLAWYFTVLHAPRTQEMMKYHTGELTFFTVLSIVPLCWLINLPTNWTQFYLLFEISSLSTTVLMASRRYSPYTVSASFTYYFTSVMVSIFILLGILFIYFETRTLMFYTMIPEIFPLNESSNLGLTTPYRTYGAIVLLFSLLMKIGVTPFHGWLMSVNTGASLHITAYMQTVYKGVLFVLFAVLIWNFKSIGFLTMTAKGDSLMNFFGFLTFGTCALATLHQTATKPFLAYLSNATIGFLLILLGLREMLLVLMYLFLYIVANIVFFAILLVFGKNMSIKTIFLTYLNDFKFTENMNVYYVYIFIFVMLISAGLPPTTIFFLKIAGYFAILKKSNLFYLSMILVIHLMILYSYFKLMKIMLFEPFTKGTSIVINPHGTFFDNLMIYGGTFMLFYFSVDWNFLHCLSFSFFN